jgi:F-type H+-transporting ATPase subunit epsilon
MISVDILSPKMSRHLDVDSIFFPGVLGPFQVLHNHAPIISLLEEGKIRWRVAGKEDSMEVRGGVVMVKDNAIQVCID